MTIHHDLEPWQTTAIATSCLVEATCSLLIASATWSASRRRPITGLAWLCGYAAALGLGRILTALLLWSPITWATLHVTWHLVTAGVGIGATRHFLKLTGAREANVHLDRALQVAISALGAQELVDNIPYPAAVLADDGGIQAVNEALTDLLGCRLRDVEGFRWARYFAGRERTRLVANWMDFSQGRIEHFYEESLWTRPTDRQRLQISTRGLPVGTQFVVGVADVTHIPAIGGYPR